MEYHHILPVQIRFNDVDKFGHVNNTVYFQFFDTAKTQYIYDVCPHVDWTREGIVVVHIESDFVSQVRDYNNIAVRTRVSHLGNKSFELMQEIFDMQSNEVKCRCKSIMVAYDLDTQKSKPIPESWKESIRQYESQEVEEPAMAV